MMRVLRVAGGVASPLLHPPVVRVGLHTPREMALASRQQWYSQPGHPHSNSRQLTQHSDSPLFASNMEDKVALVTGSTSGIGLGIAHALAANGCSVIINGFGDDQHIAAIKHDFQSKYRGRIDYVSADLTNVTDIDAMCQQITRLYSNGVDIFVSNAGFQHVSPIEDFPVEKWDAMLAVMLSAPFHIIRRLLPYMKTKGWGRIINIASAHGLVASPNKAAYVSAKHGLVGLTKVVALETAGTGITCNAMCPGYVDTPILQMQVKALAEKKSISYEHAQNEFLASFHPSKAPICVDQLGDMVVFLCSDAASQMTGSAISIDGGWTAR